MGMLGCAVANVGERDVKLGYDEFASRIEGSKIAFVSANLLKRETGESVFPSHAVVPAVSADGKKELAIGVIGVSRHNPRFLRAGPGESNMVLAPPAEPVRRAVEELKKKKVDAIVLLAALNKSDASKIATEVPGIDFVVGAYGGIFTTAEEKAGETYLLYSGNQGKRFGSTRVFMKGGSVDRQETRMHFLTRSYPANEEILAFVNSVPRDGRKGLTESTRSGARPATHRNPPPPTGPYVGSEACASCHEAENLQWSETAHARSFETLHKEQKSTEAGCLTCHVVSGFKSPQATPELAHVGCESCHGPGKSHLANERKPYGLVEIETCTGCHDLENSPNFDYYSYLERVSHGGGSSK
jgi:hypothetical protein